MIKIVTVVGARPQFIKVAPVSRVLRHSLGEILVNTGQHYDFNMAGIFFKELNIPTPDYDLGIGSGSHGKQTGEMIIKIEDVLLKEKPDAVLVYGDTNSTLAGALAASKLHIPVFHIEAGLRSFNKKMPEEINRILTDHVSTLLFSPTETAVKNLANEGITSHVYNVGDVMYDAVLYNMKISYGTNLLCKYGLSAKEYYLATIHRAENTDNPDRLRAIFESLDRLSQRVILPLHPRTVARLCENNLEYFLDRAKNILVIEPVSYLEMLTLEVNSKAIITDSGGVQKEAYFMKVPCFTLRDETEWIETVEVGWNTLVNPITMDLANIIEDFHEPPYIDNLYGDGRASEKIVNQIIKFFGRKY